MNAVYISYPEEAKGWDKGVYTERKPSFEDTGFVKEDDLYVIRNRFWTETESTGFGVYQYAESIGFKKATGLKDGKWTVTFVNPTDADVKVSCFANNILKLNAVEVKSHSEAVYDFTLCSVEDDTVLQFFNPTDKKTKEETEENVLYIRSVDYEEIPLKVPKAKPTIFLASDSTVQSYEKFYYPQTGWGQVFYRFFNKGNLTDEIQSPDLCYPQNHIYETDSFNVENRSIGARSARSFINEGKWDRLLALSAPGDFCFIQWGHNDATAVRPNRWVAPSDFGFWLKKYIRSCRARQVQLVLVTPIARRNCDDHEGNFIASFGRYRDAMVAVAEEENVPYIDLCNLTVDYLNSIGSEESKLIYLWADKGAYPNGAYADGVHDNTHLQEYGATMFAKLVAKAILDSDRPELAPLKPAINTDFEIAKPNPAADLTPSDATQPTGFALQELHIENGMANFLLIWNDVKDAVKYRVYRKGSVDFQFFPLREVSIEEKLNATVVPFTIPASDVYQVYVEAVFADGSAGAQSRIIEFRA